MPIVNASDYLNNLTDLLRETFEGTGGQGSHYIDGKGHGSLLETLGSLDHRLASRSLTTGGVTIAAHADHTRYYMHTLRRFIRDEDDVRPDWPGSWQRRTVTADEWEHVRAAVREEYLATLRHVEEVEVWDDEPLGGFLSILAHCAYHLGAIRLLAVTLQAT
ncbi:DinB family protein [Deinococcus sp. NW-56]|uniref:DinB family protein n=1 Tax=Deinococcus sp. NW-56 TaxID=2080419 RepID=UPI000CF52208|nr:DinB family protein [Deinococcus sp. NW-56]